MQIAQPAPLARQPTRRPLERQQVEHHHGPAGPAAPQPAEEQRAAELGDQVVDDPHLHDAGQQAEEEAFELGVLVAQEDGEAEQEQADQEEGQPAAERLLALG